ncbi:MAG: hypothetical protein ACKVOR_03225 [Flavobacteriales bacterium]
MKILASKVFAISIFCTCLPLHFLSQATPAPDPLGEDLTPKYVNEFLNIGVGARALGMSLAQVASVNDVTSGYWNPAGLTGMRHDMQVAAMHSEYFAGIAKYDYAAIGKSLDSVSSAALTFIRFGVDDIPNTTELIDAGGNINYDRITTFSAADYAFIFSYGRKGLPRNRSLGETGTSVIEPSGLAETFRWGINAKVIHRQVGNFAHSWGFGLDAGAQFDYHNWHFGAMVKDITSTFNAWSVTLDDQTVATFIETENAIPENGLEIALPQLALGASRSFQFKKVSLQAECNANITTDGKRNTVVSSNPFSIDPNLGIEAGYDKVVFLRLGCGNVQRVKNFDGSQGWTFQPNFGVGLHVKNLTLDYALSDIGNVSDVLYSNVFSLRIDLTKGK